MTNGREDLLADEVLRLRGELDRGRAETQRLEKANEALMAENAGLTEEVSAQIMQNRKLAREVQGLKRELDKTRKTSPKADAAMVLLENWRHWTGHPRAKIDAGTERFALALKILKNHEQWECLEAIEGVALMPYVGPRGRTMGGGQHSRRYDGIEYAIKNETTVENARKWRAQAMGASEMQLWEAHMAAWQTSDLYLRAWLARVAMQKPEEQPAPEERARLVHADFAYRAPRAA